jgi:hypothetical protein
MLPTYPEVVAKRARANRKLLRALIRQKSPILGDIGSHIVHEGGETDIVRPSGEIEPTEMRAQSAQVDIPRQRLNEFDQEQVRKYLESLAEQFAEGMTKHMFEAISNAAEKVGNVVDGKGSPLTPELMLEVLDKIDIDFNEDGTWDPPRIVVSPEQAKRLEALSKSMDQREQDRKLKPIIERKQLEYRSREAGRVLAG